MMGGLEKMKIIIDTNLWISFLLKGKVYKDLLEILASEKTTLISSQLSINEFTSVATRPKFKRYISEKQINSVIGFILQNSQIYSLRNIPSRCRDPKDDYLLELAVVSDANFLLTIGDDDLLSMRNIGKCKIISVSECKLYLTTA